MTVLNMKDVHIMDFRLVTGYKGGVSSWFLSTEDDREVVGILCEDGTACVTWYDVNEYGEYIFAMEGI